MAACLGSKEPKLLFNGSGYGDHSLRQKDIRIFNYDLLVIAQSKDLLVQYWGQILSTLTEFWFMVNIVKSQTVPCQSLVYLGISIDTLNTWTCNIPSNRLDPQVISEYYGEKVLAIMIALFWSRRPWFSLPYCLVTCPLINWTPERRIPPWSSLSSLDCVTFQRDKLRSLNISESAMSRNLSTKTTYHRVWQRFEAFSTQHEFSFPGPLSG